jgi:hypothetical protein
MKICCGLGALEVVVISLAFLVGTVGCAESADQDSVDLLKSSCESLGDSTDDLIAADDMVLVLIEQRKYEAAAACVARQIELGYKTPPKYAEMAAYLAYAGLCAEARTWQLKYMALMENRNESAPAPYSQMEDPNAEKITRALMQCKEEG